MGLINRRLFATLEHTVVSLVDKCNCPDLAAIAWAYAVANDNVPLLFDNAFTFINTCTEKTNDSNIHEVSQLHQWHLLQRELKSGVELHMALQKHCYQAFTLGSQYSSSLQNDVISVLSSIGFEPKEEAIVPITDAVVTVDGEDVWIEVDGQNHFINRQLNVVIKRRPVPSLDEIRFVSAPYWEWDERGKDKGDKVGGGVA